MATPLKADKPVSQPTSDSQIHCASVSSDPTVLADIYDSDINIAIWQRAFSADFQRLVNEFVASRQQPYLSTICAAADARAQLCEEFGGHFDAITDDIAELVDMFCCLFDLNQVGLRMTVLRDTMCPKFHVDHVPCRMVTTYCGIGAQWLPNSAVNREKLGIGSAGNADQLSGVYHTETAIQQIAAADVALLKGEGWLGNQCAGLVHRSPAIPQGESRLLLTLDFSN